MPAGLWGGEPMIVKHVIAATLILFPMAMSAQAGISDQIWTAYQSIGAPEAPERKDGIPDAVYRYQAGAALFEKTHQAVADQTPDQVIAAGGKGKLMEVSVRLYFSDRLLSCYVEPAQAFDATSASFVTAFETAMKPDERAELVARFRPSE